jgi:predicted permease
LPAAVMMACMPCGLNTIVFPKLVGEDCKIGARLALLTHLFSCFTIPVWLSVFH